MDVNVTMAGGVNRAVRVEGTFEQLQSGLPQASQVPWWLVKDDRGRPILFNSQNILKIEPRS
jgi:hypothetical protein